MGEHLMARPAVDVLRRVADRWTVLVVCALAANGVMRFDALRDLIENISQRMLAQTLRRLEEDGLLSRVVHSRNPPRVEYSLTTLGKSLAVPLGELSQWVRQNERRTLEVRSPSSSVSRDTALERTLRSKAGSREINGVGL